MGTMSKYSSDETSSMDMDEKTHESKGDVAGVEETRLRLSVRARNPRPSRRLLKRFKVSKCFQSNVRSSVYGAIERDTQCAVVLKSSRFNAATFEVYQKVLESERTHGLIKPVEFFLDEDKQMQIVLPFVKGGDLIENILDNGPMTEENVGEMMNSVSTGLDFLHNVCKVAHRDVSPENILLDHASDALLIDYGSCRDADDKKRDNEGVKLVYLAPELFDLIKSSPSHDLRKSDVWSLGCVMFVALFGIPPFETASKSDERFRHLCRYGFRSYVHAMMGPSLNCSESALNLLECMLKPNPELRPSCQEILSHSWFRIEK